MPRKLRWSLVLVMFCPAACGAPPPAQVLGAYRLADGRVVSVRRSTDDALRYRFFETGRSGRLYRENDFRYVAGPGFSGREPVQLVVEFERCERALARSLRWEARDAAVLRGERIGRERWVEFESDGSVLRGRLHVPHGPGPHPGMVLVHGSGKSAGSEWLYNGDFMVAHGVAVLAFDKRGTGGSDGDFTFDFFQLARDVVAGVEFMRKQAEIAPERVGVAGYSQGGWVAPLAASMSPHVRCALVSYGMIESPAEEAWLEMRNILVEHGVSGDDLAHAKELVRAAVEVVAQRFDAGWDEFDALKKVHGNAAWTQHLRDTPVGQLLRYPKWLVKLFGRGKLPPGLRWHYDSTALLDSLTVPTVWFLAADDHSAPNEQTIPKLRGWMDAGRAIELFVYPGADHGMLTFDEADGTRTYTGYSAAYYRDEVDAALRFLRPPAAEARSGPEVHSDRHSRIGSTSAP